MPYPTQSLPQFLTFVLLIVLACAFALAFALECLIILLIWSGAIPRELLTP